MNAIDLYCERLGAEFWAEPINALTNVSFLIAAWAMWRLSRQSAMLSPSLWLLIAATIAIGCGSFIFHTVATSWARLLDVIPILVFQLLFLWLYFRRIMDVTPISTGLLVAVYLAAAILGRQFPDILNGSLIYAPAILAVSALGVYHARTAADGRFDLLIAAGLLLTSLTFRSIDNATCDATPFGTHFMWHLLNGIVVYLSYRALVKARAVSQ